MQKFKVIGEQRISTPSMYKSMTEILRRNMDYEFPITLKFCMNDLWNEYDIQQCD